MRRKSKIVLSVFVFLFILFIIANLPIIAYGYDTCSGRTEYESFVAYQFPCSLCLFNNLETVTLSSASLSSGLTATNSSAATSSFVIALDNPCVVTTYVTSLSLSAGNYYSPTITSWDNSTQPSSPSNLIAFNSGHPGNNVLASSAVTSLTFYPENAASPQQISKGETFNYVIAFQNGQSVSGLLVAK